MLYQDNTSLMTSKNKLRSSTWDLTLWIYFNFYHDYIIILSHNHHHNHHILLYLYVKRKSPTYFIFQSTTFIHDLKIIIFTWKGWVVLMKIIPPIFFTGCGEREMFLATRVWSKGYFTEYNDLIYISHIVETLV